MWKWVYDTAFGSSEPVRIDEQLVPTPIQSEWEVVIVDGEFNFGFGCDDSPATSKLKLNFF